MKKASGAVAVKAYRIEGLVLPEARLEQARLLLGETKLFPRCATFFIILQAARRSIFLHLSGQSVHVKVPHAKAII